MKRDDVYKLIDGERDYQDKKWGASKETVDRFAAHISEYSYNLLNTQDKLEVIREIAALCVACMEQHGAPDRYMGLQADTF